MVSAVGEIREQNLVDPPSRGYSESERLLLRLADAGDGEPWDVRCEMSAGS